MKENAMRLSIVAALLACASSAWAAPEDVFAGTTKIVFTKDLEKDPAKKSVETTDKAEIAKVLETIKLEAKDPCACDHIESAVFTTPKGDVKVSLCDHCFDFGGKTYRMPAEFYKLFGAAFKK
jgi:hypothetical protein